MLTNPQWPGPDPARHARTGSAGCGEEADVQTDTVETAFGGLLRRFREDRDMTQTALAKALPCDRSYIVKIEGGSKRPGVEFAEQCDRILGTSGELAAMLRALAPRSVPAGQLGVRPLQLPPRYAELVAREDVLAALDAVLLCPGGVAVASGMPGVGKTAVAAHWAATHEACFPDGVLWADLRGFDPSGCPAAPAAVAETFLYALGVRPEAVPGEVDARLGLLRVLLSGRRMLVVLDNAASEEQVRPLLFADLDCSTVVTSRERLGGLAVRDGASHVDVPPLDTEASAWLLRSSRTRDTARTGQSGTDPAIRRVAEGCAGLPLALLLAARAPDTEQAARADAADRLEMLSRGSDARTSLRAVFSWSYEALDEAAAQVFRALGRLAPGPWRLAQIAARADLPEARAAAAMDTLTRAHLVSPSAADGYTMHPLLHAFAAEAAAEAGSVADPAAPASRRAARRSGDSAPARHLSGVRGAESAADPGGGAPGGGCDQIWSPGHTCRSPGAAADSDGMSEISTGGHRPRAARQPAVVGPAHRSGARARSTA